MRRLMLSLCFVLSLFPLAAVPGCGNSSQTPPDFGNTPIELPQHVGYALAYIEKCVAVVDLDKNEVVGIHRVAAEDELVEDFDVASNGNLFVCIEQKGTRCASKIVRVLNPSTGEIITEIVVSWGPRRISSLPGDLAIVEHAYLPYGSTGVCL